MCFCFFYILFDIIFMLLFFLYMNLYITFDCRFSIIFMLLFLYMILSSTSALWCYFLYMISSSHLLYDVIFILYLSHPSYIFPLNCFLANFISEFYVENISFLLIFKVSLYFFIALVLLIAYYAVLIYENNIGNAL